MRCWAVMWRTVETAWQLPYSLSPESKVISRCEEVDEQMTGPARVFFRYSNNGPDSLLAWGSLATELSHAATRAGPELHDHIWR